jgi:hypothetical protein
MVEGPKMYKEAKDLLDTAIVEYDQALFGLAAGLIIGAPLQEYVNY